MKLTDRERIILLLLPVAVTLLAYAWWFNVFYRHKLQTAETAYDTALAAQVKPLDLLAENARKENLRREVDDLAKRKAQLETRAAALGGKEVMAAERIQVDRQLAELLERHGVRLIETGPATKDGAAKLPKSLTEALGRFGAAPQDKTGQIRRLRLAGRFMDVLGAVEELSAGKASGAIPLSLTMAEADLAAPTRLWTLVIWM